MTTAQYEQIKGTALQSHSAPVQHIKARYKQGTISCPRCGGQLIVSYGRLACLQCGAAPLR